MSVCSSQLRGFNPIVIAIFFGLLGSPLFAQGPGEKRVETPTIESNVDEVSIDMVVHNKKDKPVLDLKPQDLTVTDDGTAAKVADLRLISGKADAAEHRITLLFDQLDPSAATNARNIATKILKMVPEHGFELSVLNISGRLHLFQEFTSDRDLLKKALALVTGDNAKLVADAVGASEKRLVSVAQKGTDLSGAQVSVQQRDAGKIMLSSLEQSQQIVQDQHTQPALAGLQAIARTQQRMSGRKVVIYFSQGLQPDSNTADALRSIAAAANRSGVSIYVINANGLDMRDYQKLVQTMAIGGAMSARTMNPTPTATGPVVGQAAWIDKAVGSQLDRFETDGLEGHHDPLSGLAMNTGGSYVSANDNFRKPMKQMLDDLSTYYELSYVPPTRDYDGKFHSVTINTARGGLRIRSRAGYFALPPNNEAVVRPFETPILKALSEAQLPADLKLQARILQLGNLSEGNTNALVVEVPISELEMRDDANTNLFSVHASIVAQIKNQAGTVIEHFSEDVPRRSNLDSKETARAGFVTLQRHFSIEPGQYVLETAVMDRFSGKMGAERQTFQVINAPSGPTLSDVALVRRMDPYSEESDAFEPLRYKHSRIVPNVSGEVVPGTKDISLFFLVHPDMDGSTPAMLEMQVLRNGGLIGQIPLQLPKEAAGEAVPYLASIKASSLPPGNYQVTETFTQGGKVAERSANFRIGGPELASATMPAHPQANDAEAITDANLEAARIASHQAQHLVITSLPPDAASRPSDEEVESILAGARKHALSYSKSLPNFLCVEMTDRSIDSSGSGKWKHKDSFAELLRYRDNQESRTTLSVNGQRSDAKREDMNGPLSLGEFGGALSMVFNPSSKADFQWKETDALATGTVQVFSYRVARENASMGLQDSGGKIYSGFHGLVYIDSATLGIRRITLEADDLADFSIHAASITVEYDYVAVGAHDYLMPVRGTISLHKGRHEADLNEIVFQNYKRYASQAKITVAP
jgi:VWFA-related protein